MQHTFWSTQLGAAVTLCLQPFHAGFLCTDCVQSSPTPCEATVDCTIVQKYCSDTTDVLETHVTGVHIPGLHVWNGAASNSKHKIERHSKQQPCNPFLPIIRRIVSGLNGVKDPEINHRKKQVMTELENSWKSGSVHNYISRLSTSTILQGLAKFGSGDFLASVSVHPGSARRIEKIMQTPILVSSSLSKNFVIDLRQKTPTFGRRSKEILEKQAELPWWVNSK